MPLTQLDEAVVSIKYGWNHDAAKTSHPHLPKKMGR